MTPLAVRQHTPAVWTTAVQDLIAQETGTIRGKFLANFLDVLKNTPDVFRGFEYFTIQAYNSGRKCLGARMIWERMRWYTSIEMQREPFKLNDHYATLFARLLMKLYPELAGFFEIRERQ